MKKISKISVILCLVFFNQFGWAQIHSNDFKEPYEDENGNPLKGSVKSIEVEKYSVVDYFGELKKDSIYEVSEFNLNDINYPLRAKVIDYKDGQTTAEWTYINTKTKNVKIIQNDLVIQEIIFEFDNRGNIIECSSFTNGALDSKEFAFYNDNNKEIEFKRYDEKGVIAERTFKKYDLKGRLIEYEGSHDWGYNSKYIYKYTNGLKTQMLYFNRDTLESKTSYKYYETGKIKEEVEEDVKSRNKYISYYNSAGNFRERISINSDGIKEILQTNKYDANNRIVYDDGYWKKYFEYNNKGNLIKEEIQYEGEDIEISKKITLFEYDDKGNWIKSIESNFYFGNPIESPKKIITERKITYR